MPQRAGGEQDARRLENVQFLFWPLSFSESAAELRQAIPAKNAKIFSDSIDKGVSAVRNRC
jgi:hypothetical protein